MSEFPQKDLNAQEYGYAFWYRFDIAHPKKLVQGNFRAVWRSLAGLSEHNDWCGVAKGQRNLAIFDTLWNNKARAGLHMCTYS